ncbi:hypothetical protein E2C01_040919 [Portunus trituberculatus]|uniref:Uncharacterized protein n=1 Tax=Portunus trituberculatus TaxID=210409 RepID=A0A5B7FL18_PORTR|nr:hypothetical protein [Portunus trituberculatus]
MLRQSTRGRSIFCLFSEANPGVTRACRCVGS